MIFRQRNKKFKMPEIVMNAVPVEHFDTFNFLGITIDKHLNWNQHVDKVSSKISRCLGILNKLKNILPLSAKLKVYNSLVLSHINYGILVWGSKGARIQNVQKSSPSYLMLMQILYLKTLNY